MLKCKWEFFKKIVDLFVSFVLFFFSLCEQKQLPSFVEKSDELKAQGVTEIICTSVNDPFVMNAWGKEQNAREYFSIFCCC